MELLFCAKNIRFVRSKKQSRLLYRISRNCSKSCAFYLCSFSLRFMARPIISRKIIFSRVNEKVRCVEIVGLIDRCFSFVLQVRARIKPTSGQCCVEWRRVTVFKCDSWSFLRTRDERMIGPRWSLIRDEAEILLAVSLVLRAPTRSGSSLHIRRR